MSGRTALRAPLLGRAIESGPTQAFISGGAYLAAVVRLSRTIPTVDTRLTKLGTGIYAASATDYWRAGIYDASGNLLAGTSAGDCSAAGTFLQDLTAPIILRAGVPVYLAVAGSDGTCQFRGRNHITSPGDAYTAACTVTSGVVDLPASITMAGYGWTYYVWGTDDV